MGEVYQQFRHKDTWRLDTKKTVYTIANTLRWRLVIGLVLQQLQSYVNFSFKQQRRASVDLACRVDETEQYQDIWERNNKPTVKFLTPLLPSTQTKLKQTRQNSNQKELWGVSTNGFCLDFEHHGPSRHKEKKICFLLFDRHWNKYSPVVCVLVYSLLTLPALGGWRWAGAESTT